MNIKSKLYSAIVSPLPPIMVALLLMGGTDPVAATLTPAPVPAGGTYDVYAGDYTVALSNDADGYVMADAIKLEPQP